MEYSKSSIKKLLNLRKEVLILTIDTTAFAKLGIEADSARSLYENRGKRFFTNQMLGLLYTKVQQNEIEIVEDYLNLLKSYQGEEERQVKKKEKSSFKLKSDFVKLKVELHSIISNEIIPLEKKLVLTRGWHYFCECNQCSFELPQPNKLKLILDSEKTNDKNIDWRIREEYYTFNELFSILEEKYIVLILANYFVINHCVEVLKHEDRTFNIFQSEYTPLRFEYYSGLFDLMEFYGYNLSQKPNLQKYNAILELYALINDHIKKKLDKNIELRDILLYRVYIEPPFLY